MTTESMKDSFSMLQMNQKETTQILLEEDILVPDTKPDLSKIIFIEGKIKIMDKNISNDKVNVTGKLQLKILYTPFSGNENATVVPMECNIDFRQEIDCLYDEKVDIKFIPDIEHIDYNIINERKLKIKVLTNILTKGYETYEVDMIKDEMNSEMQYLKEQIKYTDIVQREKETIDIKEEIGIKDNMPEIGEVLSWDIHIFENQRQIVNQRAVINATLQYNIMYLSNEIEPVPVMLEEKSEFTQFIDIKEFEGSVDSKADFSVEYSNVSIKKDIEDNATLLNMEATIATDLEITKNKEKEIIIDAYHPMQNIEVEKGEIHYKLLHSKNASDIQVREIINLFDDNKQMENIVSVQGKVVETNNYVEADKNIIEGVLAVHIIYETETEEGTRKIHGMTDEIPFRHYIDIKGVGPSYEIEKDFNIRKIDYEKINNRQIEINSEIFMKSRVYAKESHEVLRDVAIQDQEIDFENTPSIIIYIVKKDDNLWKIAKNNRTTIREIEETNNIDYESQLVPGQKLILLKSCK
ncbi:MAG: SPOCS domain-containing protein [Peptostreptococcales bacterium]